MAGVVGAGVGDHGGRPPRPPPPCGTSPASRRRPASGLAGGAGHDQPVRPVSEQVLSERREPLVVDGPFGVEGRHHRGEDGPEAVALHVASPSRSQARRSTKQILEADHGTATPGALRRASNTPGMKECRDRESWRSVQGKSSHQKHGMCADPAPVRCVGGRSTVAPCAGAKEGAAVSLTCAVTAARHLQRLGAFRRPEPSGPARVPWTRAQRRLGFRRARRLALALPHRPNVGCGR